MASAASCATSYFAFLPVLLLSVSFLVRVRGGVTHHQVNIHSLLPSDACSPYKEPASSNHARLRVVHRHGACSPLGSRQKFSDKQILEQDQVRVDSLHRRVSMPSKPGRQLNTLAETQIPAHFGSSFGIANYIVTVGFGTPETDQTVIFDTGSDATWIQCQPCKDRCYQQQDPIFDPSQSSTYVNIPCSSPYCSELDNSTQSSSYFNISCNPDYCSHLGNSSCSSSTCVYGIQYGDSSSTVAFYVEDTLTLTPTDVIPNFRFGCGQNNEGLFGQAAGLIALGRGETSLVSQAYQKYNGVFAYCLPRTSSSTGFLTFGSGYPSSNLQFTPMLSNTTTPTFYYVNLTAISVGGQKLSILPTVFSTAGTIVDSGTVITRLPPTAYSALRSAFRQKMSAYRRTPAFSILDTCYDLSGNDTVTLPAVALHFDGGVTTDLDVSGTLYVENTSQACLAFAANGDDADVGILGNVQQRGFNVVFDVSKQVIGFGPCDTATKTADGPSIQSGVPNEPSKPNPHGVQTSWGWVETKILIRT